MKAKIATKQATFTLERLHAELGGRILANKAEAKRLAQAMKHVEAVLKLLDPGYSVRPIAVRRRKPNQWFRRGTVLRHALDALRKAGKPALPDKLPPVTFSTLVDYKFQGKRLKRPEPRKIVMIKRK